MDFFFLLSQFHADFKKHSYDFFKSDQQLKEHLFKMFLLHVNRSLRSKFNT